VSNQRHAFSPIISTIGDVVTGPGMPALGILVASADGVVRPEQPDRRGPLASIPLAAGMETFVAAAPPGTYMIRMRAVGPTLVSGPSNAVTIALPDVCAVPAAPQGFAAASSGNIVTISWRLGPVGSPAPWGFALEARTPGGTLIATIPLAGHELRATAPAGTYVLRLRATSPCGSSAPTPDVVLTVS
jgi:hypothetical protein